MNADELMQAVIARDTAVTSDYTSHLGGMPKAATQGPNGVHVMPFIVGFFPSFNATAYMVTMMKPEMADNGDDIHDFRFGLLIKDSAERTSALTYDYRATALLIPHNLRQAVKARVIASVSPLLFSARARRITMHTAEANLPVKAMQKYDDIVAELQTRRFSESSWMEEGRTYWDFERD